ncbi:zinc finger protein [Apis mellifera carnica]|nr:zinc finger protein [Apis mellifera carnica]
MYIYIFSAPWFFTKNQNKLRPFRPPNKKGNRRRYKNFPKKRLLATMLLSQDVQQPQDNNEPLWNQLPYPGFRGYEASRSQRRKDSKDAGSKYACNRCGKTYKATTSLSRHKRLECGVIPCEVCPICDRRFKHRFVLNSHIVGCQRKLRHIIQKNDDSPVFTEERE